MSELTEADLEDAEARITLARRMPETVAIEPARIVVEKDAPELIAEVRRLRSLIGDPPAGSHPDEWTPRAETWHGERINWMLEVERLRAELEKERAPIKWFDALQARYQECRRRSMERLRRHRNAIRRSEVTTADDYGVRVTI